MIEEEFAKAFKKFDAIVIPAVPRLPHKIGSKISVEEMYSYDALTIPANLAGNCAISIPTGRLPLIENVSPAPITPTYSSPDLVIDKNNLSKSKLSPIHRKVVNVKTQPSTSTASKSSIMVPVGMQIMCDKFQDWKMLEIAKMVEGI